MEAVFKYLAREQTRFVRELEEYLRFPSVSAQQAHRRDMHACAHWLAQHCRQLGLASEVVATPGHPVVIARTWRGRRPAKPHFLVYGHYDVQPPDPLELWDSPPFAPRRVGKYLYARGSSDNKGQHFAHLKAIEACRKTGTELPCDLTFVIEGEEEVGSANLAGFLEAHRASLRCRAVVISDTGIPDLAHPALTYALRGIAALEVEVRGPSRDLHSGIYGGSVENPALALCAMLAALRDRRGRVAIPGFYDDVVPLTPHERRELRKIPHDDRRYARFLGVPALSGEAGFTATERRTARPTLEINGLTSGYQGEGSKTIVPAWARAKLTLRLVPNQKPQRVARLVTTQLRRLCPSTVRLRVTAGHGAEPYVVSPTGPLAQAALRALHAGFQASPILLREGGSIPIVSDFRRILGVDSLLLGLALPDANAHSPNESFHLDAFAAGMRTSARLWAELAPVASAR